MSTGLERRAARVERLRSIAARRGADAEAAFASVRAIGSNIPMGQPILVGHHSEKRARRDVARMNALMGKSCEAAAESKDAARLADRLERGDAPVLLTDDDARPQIVARIAEAEAQHAKLLAFAKRLRAEKSHEGKIAMARAAGYGGAAEHVAVCGVGTTNTAAAVRRAKERLSELDRVEARGTVADVTIAGVRISDEDDRTRIFFDGKPADDVRSTLKANGFRWSPTAGAWQRQRTDAARRAAEDIVRGHFTEAQQVRETA